MTGILGLIELQQRHELSRMELKNRKAALEFGNPGYGDLLDAEFKRLADEGRVAGGQYSVLQIAEVLARVGEHPVYGVDATVAKFAQDQAQQLPLSPGDGVEIAGVSIAVIHHERSGFREHEACPESLSSPSEPARRRGRP